MSNNKLGIFKYIGCILLVISSMIGGGIFALPIMAFKLGIIATIILTLLIYVLMTISGLLVVEISIKLPRFRNHYTSLAYEAFGMPGKVLALIAFSIAIYAALTAYIGATPALIKSDSYSADFNFYITPTVVQVTFTGVLATVLIYSMKYSEHINRLVMTIKLMSLVTVIFLLSKFINISNLFIVPINLSNLIEATLIIILAFSYQSILPSIVSYVGPDYKRQIRNIILVGTLITCIIYLLWIIAIAGFIKSVGADRLFISNPTLEQLVAIIKNNSSNSIAIAALNVFLNITLFASFLTISIAFIDFWIDALGLNNNIYGRLIAGATALLPSLLIALFFNKIFVVALTVSGFAGIAYSILLPSATSYKLFDKYNKNGSYFFGGGKNVRGLITLIAIVFMILAMYF
ncbi:tyrosine-specific transport protein [Allofrancisella inopinata]|uniref:Tyrosine-specific transport protein n=1 Tax=Allofrancisella inopinata TaxID=1085647 RepID=A0AAE6YHV2_9GAMM|nr:aromatic amino acid transport family protein [Allofrancisella inopinata]QIV95901.1 hypothetical protein E4K63_03280 [Allofrancisella inopinata]TDT74318.1 tyrosine-specific transport protein [Allofrancisella inopinata]